MDQNDKAAIEGLFQRLDGFGRNAPPRDAEAEQFIEQCLRRQPGAAYYMAQTVVAQERALEQAQARIAELEQTHAAAPAEASAFRSPWARPRPQAGGGFLAGAAQTAMGVAGGVLLANMLTGMFSDGSAEAGELSGDAAGESELDGGFDDIEF